MTNSDDPDRAAILARRRHFIAAALDRLESVPIRPRTGVVVIAVASLATACPCLEMSPPETSTADTEDPSETGGTTGGTTGETDTTAGPDLPPT